MAYFERQVKRNCTIHAINNLLGFRAVTVKSMNDTVQQMADEYAQRPDLRRRKTYEELYAFFVNLISSKDGNYSPSVAENWLKNHGYIVCSIDRHDVNFSKGSYILAGSVRGISHAVALKDGILFDSLENAPIDLKGTLPQDTVIFYAMKVGKRCKRGKKLEPIVIE